MQKLRCYTQVTYVRWLIAFIGRWNTEWAKQGHKIWPHYTFEHSDWALWKYDCGLLPQTSYSFRPGEIGRCDTRSLMFGHYGTYYYLKLLTFGPGEMAPIFARSVTDVKADKPDSDPATGYWFFCTRLIVTIDFIHGALFWDYFLLVRVVSKNK